MRRSVGWLAFLVAQCARAAAQSQQAPSVCRGTPEDIPSTSFQLSNGLTVVLHEDHKAPAGELPRALMMGARWAINVCVAEWIIRQRQVPAISRFVLPAESDLPNCH